MNPGVWLYNLADVTPLWSSLVNNEELSANEIRLAFVDKKPLLAGVLVHTFDCTCTYFNIVCKHNFQATFSPRLTSLVWVIEHCQHDIISTRDGYAFDGNDQISWWWQIQMTAVVHDKHGYMHCNLYTQ